MNRSIQVKSFQPPRIDKCDVSLINDLCGKSVNFSDGGKHFTLAFNADPKKKPNAGYYLCLDVGGIPVDTYLDSEVAELICDRLFPLEKLKLIPDDILLIGLNARLDPILNRVDKYSGKKCEITHFKTSSSLTTTKDITVFDLLKDMVVVGKVYLPNADENLIHLIGKNFQVMPEHIPSIDMLPIFDTKIILDELKIPWRDIHDLSINDVVITNHKKDNGIKKSKLIISDSYSGTIKMSETNAILEDKIENLKKISNRVKEYELDNQKEISKSKNLQEETKKLGKNNFQENNEILNRDSILVNMSFEVSCHKISYNDLLKMTPGYIFNTKKPLDSDIGIFIGDRFFGKGDLVEIGDKIGVRIKEINNGSHE